jgi:hypothetical protein
MKIMTITQERVAGFVAHDDDPMAFLLHGGNRLQASIKGVCLIHAAAVNHALHLCPDLLDPGSSQVVANGLLTCRKASGNVPTLESHAVKQRIVGNNGVVKIKPDDHANKKFKRKIFKSR